MNTVNNLLNLIVCDNWEPHFVDAYSEFSLRFHQQNFGPAYLHLRSMINTWTPVKTVQTGRNSHAVNAAGIRSIGYRDTALKPIGFG